MITKSDARSDGEIKKEKKKEMIMLRFIAVVKVLNGKYQRETGYIMRIGREPT